MSQPNGFDIGDYYADHEQELLVDFIDKYPEVWQDWLNVKYGENPEPENSYDTFLNDIECSQFKVFEDWAVSYIQDMVENDTEHGGDGDND